MNISITLESVCSGGGHATIGVVVDGGSKKTFVLDVDDIRSPLADREDRDTFLLDIVRLAVTGLTKVQARNKLQAGLAIIL